MRSGHTEAAVDLCKLAGLPPVAVICELANDDGTVMVGPQVEAFAEKHRIKRISVADLIAYRQAREKLVERVACFPIQTPIGELQGYAYRTPFDPVLHFAFVHGEHRRRARHAGASASGRYLERHFRRRRHPEGAEPLQGGGARRARLPARRRGGGAGEPERRAARRAPTTRARPSGGRSGLAPRSCATSASPRSGCAPTIRAPMSGFRASASRSRRSSRSTAERAALKAARLQPQGELRAS